MDFQKIMHQAQKMQQALTDMQQYLAGISVEASSSDGRVTVELFCSGQPKEVKIFSREPHDSLEYAIAEAINAAREKVDERIKLETEKMMQNLIG